MEYRRKYGAATIVEDWQPSAVMDECIAGGLFGEDREGHPVWYDNFGNLDPRGKYICSGDFLLSVRVCSVSVFGKGLSKVKFRYFY